MISPRWAKLALVGIAAVPAAIGIQALPAVGQSSPSVAAIRLGSGKIAARGAVAYTSAIIACPAGAQAFIQVQLTERSGNGIAQGYGNAQPLCTGNIQDISVPVTASIKPFVRGTAFGQAQIFLNDGSNNSDTRNVKLR
jgi:hypothetical protein